MLSRFELRRFRGLLPKLALIFAALVPVFYGAIYLGANWNPAARMDHLPVAVVNEDIPVDYQGKHVQAGKDFTDSMLEKRNFDWHVVTAAEAERGLREGDYYLTVHVPSDFSANLVSGGGTDPQRAGITLRRNDANGFVIGSLVARAQDSITEAVDQTAVESYFRAVFGNLAEIRGGMVNARDGSVRLRDGLAQAKDGSAQLATGTSQAADAGAQLHEGAGQLASGMGQLQTGSQQLSDGMSKLSSGSQDLANGADQVAAGTQTLHDTVVPALQRIDGTLPQIKSDASTINTDVQSVTSTVGGSSQSISNDLSQLSSALDQLAAADPQVTQTKAYADARQRLRDGQQRAEAVTARSAAIGQRSATLNGRVQGSNLSGDLKTAESKLAQLNDGAHAVASGADTLHRGIVTADHGAGQLQAGINSAAGGAQQLNTGSGQLADGLVKLKDGAARLDTGNQQLLDGANQLASGLSDGVNRLPVLSPEQTDQAVQVLSSPADVRMDVLNPAGAYGRGLAPLFFSIALWVFGISGFLVMRPISGRLLAGRLHPLHVMLSAWLPFGTVAFTGGMLMLGTVWVVLGLDPVHPLAAIALTGLVALTFSLIAHLLRMALGLPGSAVLLVVLILQLASTGGTYPREVLPPFFAAINPFMPITYSIDAFRVVISGGLWSHFWRDVLVLLGIAAVAIVLDVTAVASRQRFRMTDLHPPLQH
ncbi:YhgE/Pip domain-containing protein [Naumannella sp. ID2617S]|nr:YhgE/Pip domain-containing protein [Naumannella sp. ID2617S]